MTPISPAEIAHRDARRMAEVLRELGGHGVAVGSGWMACDTLGSWATFAAGVGLDSAVSEQTFDTMTAFYRDQDRVPRIQVTPFQHPSLMAGLEARDFDTCENETMLVHTLQEVTSVPCPAELSFRRLDPSNSEHVAAFCESQITGFFDDANAPAGFRPITERVARHPRAWLWFLEYNGKTAGCGGLEFFENSAVLFGACVHPQWRRKGLQSAFIQFRLEHAKAAGADYALLASAVGGPTERNGLRARFNKVYTQMLLEQSSMS